MNIFIITLEIMAKGMLGIFAAALIIWLAVWAMGMLCRKEKKDSGVSNE